jgi:hypothetical protein
MRTHLHELGIFGISELQRSLDDKKLNASGKLRASFQVDVNQSSFGITLRIITNEGKAYWQVLNAAERQGGRPPVMAIFEWSKFKPISFSSEKARMSFAYAVATNIGKGLYMKTFNRDARKNFAADVFDSNQWKIKEAQAVIQIGDQITTEIVGTFFNRPQPAT